MEDALQRHAHLELDFAEVLLLENAPEERRTALGLHLLSCVVENAVARSDANKVDCLAVRMINLKVEAGVGVVVFVSEDAAVEWRVHSMLVHVPQQAIASRLFDPLVLDGSWLDQFDEELKGAAIVEHLLEAALVSVALHESWSVRVRPCHSQRADGGKCEN